MNNCYFCSTNAIFAVQMLFLQNKCYFCSTNAIFWCAEQKKIWARSTNFCRLMARVLLPYGTSFAAVQTLAASWRKFCHIMVQVLPPYFPVLINRAVQNPGSKFFFLGGVCVCVCVKVSPRTVCCCQKTLNKRPWRT